MNDKDGTNWKDSNPLLTHIRNKGVSLWQLARILDMAYPTIKKWIREPAKYLTFKHIVIIAGMTNTPIIYIVALINGTRICYTDKWYNDQMQTIDLTFLTNIPTNDPTKDT